MPDPQGTDREDVMMRRATWTTGAVVGTLLAAASAAAAQAYPELSRDEEIRLAMSAGPLAVSRQADVWVMSEGGFERAIEGTNGWACIVVRVAAQPENLAPHCLNPDAVATVLPAMLTEGRLQRKGLDAEAIDTEMRRRFDAGELRLPSGPAHAYMLSSGQRLGPANASFKPHFMLYLPYATNASVGGDPGRPELPFVGPYENHPLSTLVIIMDEFVDPADVTVPRR